MTTSEEALRKGDHNVISLAIVNLVGKSTFPKLIAPFYAEFFGTMMLCLVVGLSNLSALAPFAIGSILMCMVFTYGHLSGGHFNPAVSLAVMMRGKISPLYFVLYTVSQVIGGLAGVGIAHYALASEDFLLKNTIKTPLPTIAVDEGPAFLLEFIFTLALCTTVLNTATTVSVGDNSFYGLAIGFVVLAGAVSVGGLTGGVFNPAVGTALFIVRGDTAEGLWRYWVAPMLGGLVAGIMFHIVNSDENDITFGKSSEINIESAAVGAHVGKYKMSISEGMGSKDFSGRSSTMMARYNVKDAIAEEPENKA